MFDLQWEISSVRATVIAMLQPIRQKLSIAKAIPNGSEGVEMNGFAELIWLMRCTGADLRRVPFGKSTF